jgi:hypothetical protein
MKLDKEKEKSIVSRTVEIFDKWKTHWDKMYDGIFADYRRLADGQLDKETAEKYNTKEYSYNSKLIPQVIPNVNEFLKTTIINSIFNRDEVFEIIGRRQNDSSNADDMYDVISYESDEMQLKEVCQEIVEDALEIGIGYGANEYYKRNEPAPKLNENGVIESMGIETTYEGARLIRKRPESIYPDPDATKIEDITGYGEYVFVNISDLLVESKQGGIYFDFADNVNSILPGDFDTSIRQKLNRYVDHANSDSVIPNDIDDYPVILLQMWRKLADKKGDIPTWHLIVIANPKTNPQLIRYDIDPFKTGRHPLVACRVFPKNDRLVGKCTSEKIKDYMLEKFQGKNRIIDITNDIADLAGMLFAPDTTFDKSSMAVKRKKVVKTMVMANEIKNIPLDSTPIIPLMNREDRIDNEIQETMAMPPIRMGMAPNRRDPATTSSIVDENSKVRGNGPIKAVEDTLMRPTIKDFIILSQLHLPTDIAIRILGKDGNWNYRNVAKKDIQGFYDIKFYGSTEVLTKGVKLALFEKAIQIFGMNPHVRLDWQGVFKKYIKMAEIPGGDKFAPELSWDEANAERENEAMLAGVVWKAIESDNHEVHIPLHLKAKDVLEQFLAIAQKQNNQESIGKLTEVVSNFDTHLQQHQQFRQAINGQMNIGAGSQIPMMSNQQELLGNIASNQNTEVLGNG